MRIDTKEGRFYVNLPSKLFNKIKEIAEIHQDIDLAILGLLLHFILSEKYKDKNLSKGAERVPLNAKILNKYNYDEFKTKTHLEVLVEEGILERTKYYKGKRSRKGKSRTYKILDEYFEKDNKLISFNSPKIVKNFSKHHAKRRAIADYKCEHLTKWLQHEGLSMDTEEAKAYVDEKFNSEDDKYVRDKRIRAIDDFCSYQTVYSREGKDDRLHHFFTTLPSDLKKFVTFNREKLQEADIKNSQPFIFSHILSLIKQEYEIETEKYGSISYKRFSNRLYKIFKGLVNEYYEGECHIEEGYRLDIREICNSITIMLQKAPKPLDFTEINTFISLVRSGQIYEYVGEKFLNKGSIIHQEGKYWVCLYDKEKKQQKYFDFETLRKCAKKVTINALYGSPYNKRVTAIEHFKSLFPQVTKYLSAMKSGDKADLAILMQRIESKCILDHCSKKIAKKYPEMPLICRHDSLSTTVDWLHILKREFNQLLNNYFDMVMRVEVSNW